MTFAQRRNRLTMHLSERHSVVKRRISVTDYSAMWKGERMALTYPWLLELQQLICRYELGSF